MCLDPASLTAMALMGGSTIAKNRQMKAVRRKQDTVSQTERERQAKYQKQAQATLDKTMATFDRPAQDQSLATTAAQHETAINDTQAQPGDYTPTTGSAPPVVKSEIAKRMADAVRQGRGEVMARAKLGAYGGVQQKNAIDLNRSGQDIGRMGDFSRGSAGIMPLEMNAAYGAGRKWGQISDLFRMGGYGLALYGAMQPAPINYATSPAQVANVKSSLEEAYPMTYTDPNDLIQARKLGMIR